MSVTFTKGAANITIPNPVFGYESTLKMAFTASQFGESYYAWDNGVDYDSRYCRCKFALTAAQGLSLIDFLTDTAKGRGNDITLGLGSSSGFFPFGPDLGDSGNYTVRVVSWNEQPTYNQPGSAVDIDVEMTMIASPGGYSLPAAETEGSFRIGTLTALRWPSIYPVMSTAMSHVMTQSGVAYESDIGIAGDTQTSTIEIQCRKGNAGRLAYYLTQTARTADITVVAPTRLYLFGSEIGSSGTYTTRLVRNELSIVHNNPDAFLFRGLNFWRKATV